jgi:hypothetical protein
MEPGHEDREDQAVANAPIFTYNPPQWSPVTRTGKTPSPAPWSTPRMPGRNGARSRGPGRPLAQNIASDLRRHDTMRALGALWSMRQLRWHETEANCTLTWMRVLQRRLGAVTVLAAWPLDHPWAPGRKRPVASNKEEVGVHDIPQINDYHRVLSHQHLRFDLSSRVDELGRAEI